MNSDELLDTFHMFRGDNGLMEVMAINMQNNKDNYSGIFDNDRDILNGVIQFDKMPYNLYFRINELMDSTRGLAQYNKMVKGAKTIQDSAIKFRRWLFLDFDPIRDGGVSDIASSDDELSMAKKKTIEVRAFLTSIGFPQPIICCSANGYHALYRLNNVENTEETKETLKNAISRVSMQFTDENVDIDRKVFNAARLTKFYNSVSHKGSNTELRPHRKSSVLACPENISTVPFELIEKLSNEFIDMTKPDVKPQRQSYYNGNREQFNIDDFISKHGIGVLKEINMADGTRKIILNECPFHKEHGKDSAIFVNRDGAISFTCFHNGCTGNDWHALRLMFEPNAYDEKPSQQAQQFYRAPYQQAQKKYVIKEETSELGAKWLEMSNIKRVDIESLEHIKTGVFELDKVMHGLYLGEVTIVSGSNSSGKSSWLNNVILSAIEQNYKAALWSGELPAYVLKMWIQQVAAGRKNCKPSKTQGLFYVPDYVGKKIDSWMDGKFFLYNNEYTNNWEQIFNDMDSMVSAGVKLFVLDNLYAMDIEKYDGDKNNKQKCLIVEICKYAKKNMVHIVLVAHPKKSTAFLRKDDISGTSDLTNAVDNVLILHRVNRDFLKFGGEFLGAGEINQYQSFGNVVECCKNRMFGVMDYLVGMYYEIESRRFKNFDNEDLDYSWDTNAKAVQSSISDGIKQNPFSPNTCFDGNSYSDMNSKEDCPF